jgi:hypothetical protein
MASKLLNHAKAGADIPSQNLPFGFTAANQKDYGRSPSPFSMD